MWLFLAACAGPGGLDASDDTAGPDDTEEPDLDGDGYSTLGGDCDDYDAAVSPAATDVGGDGFDANCDGTDVAVVLDLDDVGPSWTGGDAQYFGTSVRIVPDLDDDGLVDVVAGATNEWGASEHDDAGHGSWIALTAASRVGTDIGSAWSSWWSEGSPFNEGGYWVGASTDLTGDGRPDLVLPIPADNFICVVSGPTLGEHGLYCDASIRGTEEGSRGGIGYGVLAEEDWTGDGLPDLVTIAQPDLSHRTTRELRVYAGPVAAGVLSEAYDSAISTGVESDGLGRALVGGFDGDGDGYGDLWVTEETTDYHRGEAWLLRGPIGDGELDTAAAAVVIGEESAWVGSSVAVGDFDGDGRLDTAIGSRLSDATEESGGRVGVFFGPFTGTGYLSEAPGQIGAEVPWGRAGSALVSGFDLDGDGADDLVVGTPNPWYDQIGSPGLLFVFGRLEPGTTTTAGADYALRSPVLDDYAGDTLHGPGDVDGDGVADFVYGAPRDRTLAEGSGRVGIVLGGRVAEALGF